MASKEFNGLLKAKVLRGLTRKKVETFFAGAAAHKDKVDLIVALAQDQNKTKLRALLTFSADIQLHGKAVLPFLLALKREKALRQGTCRTTFNEVILLFFEAPGIARLYLDHALGKCEKGDLQAITWLFLMAATADREARHSELVQQLAEHLSASSSDDAMYLNVMLGKDVPSSSALPDAPQPGGRHDNDLKNFRDIAIPPTPEEIRCDDPYLPFAAPDGTATERASRHLGRQFRLLREDYVGAVRDALKDTSKTLVFQDARFEHVIGDKFTAPGLSLRFSFPPGHAIFKMSDKKRVEFLTRTKSLLMFQSTICLLEDARDAVVAFATIVDRPIDKITGKDACIGVAAPGADWSHLTSLVGAQQPFRFVSLRTALFSYDPVLRTLQGMTSVPFDPEFLLGQPSLRASNSDVFENNQAVDGILRKLDSEQREAARRALAERVSLVQGPPGTGKTFLGVAVAEMLLTEPDEVILVISYTNHALNEFLCSLLNVGISSILRLGGGCKEPLLMQFTTKEIHNIPTKASRALFAMKKSADGVKEEALREAKDSFSALARSLGPGSWKHVQELLEGSKEEKTVLELTVPRDVVLEAATDSGVAAANQKAKKKKRRQKGKKGQKGDMGAKRVMVEGGGNGEEPEAFSLVGDKGKAIGNDYLWRRWLKGQDQGVLKERMERTAAWKLTKAQRLQLVRIWEEEYFKGDARQTLEDNLLVAGKASARQKAYTERNDVEKGKGRRVIGCTTTGAAKYGELLGQLPITTVLIEEAGEQLEAHVLASLAKLESLRRTIFIGDHKQLRPKLGQYRLSVASGEGFDFDRSLFERLILSETIPPSILAEQHRMRPEFSSIVRKMTYPALRDHSSVDQLAPTVEGLESNFIFVDHQVKEDRRSDPTDTSKVNSFEAKFVAATVAHLLKQGFVPSDIVVLTPYLGQLLPIKAALKKVNSEALIDQRDFNDLVRRGEISPDEDMGGQTANKKRQKSNVSTPTVPVRVSTVDNFQGEEANIVVCSLVRSNDSGDIGFLKDAERVNVLFSRMRTGMICFGNLTCLANARNNAGRALWTKMRELLSPVIRPGLPLMCPRHGDVVTVGSAEELHAASPQGGCTAICDHLLPCMHSCPLPCHDGKHDSVRCKELVEGHCREGHHMRWACGKKPKTCANCQKIAKEKKKMEEDREEEARQRRDALNADACAAALAEEERKAAVKETRLEEERGRLRREAGVAKIKASEAQKLLAFRREHREKELNIELQQVELAECKRTKAVMEDLARKLDSSKTRVTADLHSCGLGRNFGAPGNGAATPSAEFAGGAARSERMKEQLESSSTDCQEDILEQQMAFLLTEGSPEECCTLLRDVPLSVDVSALMDRLFGASAARAIVAAAKTAPRSFLATDTERTAVHLALEGKKLAAQKASGSGSLLREYLKADFGPDLAEESWADTEVKLKRKTKFRDCDLFAVASLSSVSCSGHANTTACRHAAGFSIALLLLVDSSSTDGVDLAVRENAKQLLLGHGLPALGLCSPGALSEEQSELSKVQQRNRMFKDQWEQRKIESGAQSKAMDELVSMTGLLKVKELFLTIHSSVWLAKKRGDKTPVSYSALFQGNPGTGKTTVARLYGRFLKDIGAVPGDAFEETTGVKLIEGGVKGLQELLGKIENAKGGLLFVDEAYQLATSSLGQGVAILNYFLDEMVNKVGNLVVVFAGYQDQIEKLIELNEGLPSRFPHSFVFADYEEEELHSIFEGLVEKRNKAARNGDFHIEGGLHGKAVRIAIKRLAKGRQTRGFGNARAVGTLLQRVIDRQGTRVEKAPNSDIWELTRDDMLGKRVTTSLTHSKAWKALQEMTGLEEVKDSISALVDLVSTNAELEELEKPPRAVALNRLFLGNPGTGKTTVAHLYGKILFEIGLLSKGDVVSKTASDFVGSVLGQSEEKTKSILKQAAGCVLLIDEAYGLCPTTAMGGSGDIYRESVINALVEGVQNVPGEDLCVIMIGYKPQMEEMMRVSNPGLARRFALDQAFHFHDYSDDALLTILENILKKKSLAVTGKGKMAAIDMLAKQRRGKNFGNAGAVNNLISAAIVAQEARLKGMPVQQRVAEPLIALDFNAAAEDELDLDAFFEEFVGAEEVLQVARQLLASVKMAEMKGKDVSKVVELTFLFTGSPGTGKTTVARKFGELFCGLGILSSSEVVETSASDFITGFVGQAAKRTREIFESAAGKVLFVDEAYALSPQKGGQFAGEALDEMTKLLTDEQFHGKMVVILAGYPNEIDLLLNSNPGLKSRFQSTVPFRDMSPADACTLLEKLLAASEFSLSVDAKQECVELMAQLSAYSDWSNGRDVKTLTQKMAKHLASRLTGVPDVTPSAWEVITPSDVKGAFRELMAERRAPGVQALPRPPAADLPERLQAANASPPPCVSVDTATAHSTLKKEAAEALPTADGRDSGVSEAVWQQLQADKAESKRLREAALKALEEAERQARMVAEEAERKRIEALQLKEEARRRAEEEARRLAKEAREKEEAARLLREQQERERKKEAAVQAKLQQMGVCPAGFQWIKQAGGYRCGGGSHFVPNKSLGMM